MGFKLVRNWADKENQPSLYPYSYRETGHENPFSVPALLYMLLLFSDEHSIPGAGLLRRVPQKAELLPDAGLRPVGSPRHDVRLQLPRACQGERACQDDFVHRQRARDFHHVRGNPVSNKDDCHVY